MTLDELDGVDAARDHHKVLFENEHVRVLETSIRAGDATPLHTHLAPTVLYVVSGSHFVRRDEHGATLLDTRANPDFVLPKVMFSPSNPRHTLENTGSDDLVVIRRRAEEPDTADAVARRVTSPPTTWIECHQVLTRLLVKVVRPPWDAPKRGLRSRSP